MSFYFPNVDPAYIYKRKGDSSDPYIPLNEIAQVVNGVVTLREVPDYTAKVITKKLDGTTLTEVTTETLQTNQYRVDYSTGVVYLHSSLESNKLTFQYNGTGYVSFPSTRVWVDTGGSSSNKSLQQLFTDIDNIKTNWLVAVTTYSNIATTYPTPKLGDTVQTTDDARIYRYDGNQWKNTQQYTSNAITNFQNRLDGLSKVSNTYEWTATAGQLTYSVPSTAILNDKWLEVTVGGATLASSLVRVDSATQFTLLVNSANIIAGVKVTARWIEPYIAASFGHKATHEKGGNDEIDVTQLKNYQESIASPLSDIAYNAKNYGIKADNTTDDTVAIQSFINNVVEGSILYFPFLNGCKVTSDITIDKSVTIIGYKRPYYDGTTLQNGTFLNGFGFKVSNTTKAITVKIINFGVITSSDNAFEIRGLSNDTVIENCIGVARDHSYLIEEYEGSIERTKVKNCMSYNSTHGFVSKAKRTIFENCYAYNHSANGYVIVSDNINGATKLGLALNNTLENCLADTCQVGFNAYCRDYYSTTNTNNILHENLSLINCRALNSTAHGFMLGDGLSAPSGQTYNPVRLVTMKNCFEKNSTNNSLRIERVTNADIEIVCFAAVYNNDTNNKQVKLRTNADVNEVSNFHSIESLAVNSTTPSVKSGRKYFKTANTAATIITNFADANDGQEIELLITEEFTQIQNGGNFNLFHGVVRGNGSRLKLYFDGSKWNEIQGNVTGRSEPQDIISNGTIDLKKANVWDLQGSGTSQVLTFSNKSAENRTVTLMFRSTSGTTPLTFSFGSGIQLPTGFPTQATFSTMVVATFVYNDTLTKWFNISWQNVPTGN